jgi:hypothetical protein
MTTNVKNFVRDYVCLYVHVLFTLFVFYFRKVAFCLSSSCALCTQCCKFLLIVHSCLLLSFDHCVVCHLRFTYSDSPFCIFKLFLPYHTLINILAIPTYDRYLGFFLVSRSLFSLTRNNSHLNKELCDVLHNIH